MLAVKRSTGITLEVNTAFIIFFRKSILLDSKQLY